eukprot:Hpha_TRINITY_DN11614_c0_g1::TRINITY_DN11614_c0_g1_i1::g.49020::m.49020
MAGITTLGLMKVAVGTGAGAGFAAGVARYIQLHVCSEDSDEEDEEEQGGAEGEAEGEEAKLQKQIRRWKREDDRDMSVMRVMLRAMSGAGALTILGGVPFAVYAKGATWSAAWACAGDSILLFLPVGLMLSVGATGVAQNLPSFFMGMTISSSVLTIIGLPVQMLFGASPATVHTYLTGLRIGVSGASGLMIAMFCNRYARLQGRKRYGDGCSKWLRKVNSGSIIFSRIVGHVLSAAWLFSVYPTNMPYTLLEMSSIVYMYSLQVHLLVPSTDHDVRAEINILRNMCLGTHALTVVTQVTAQSHPTAAAVQRLFAFSTNAAYFGTFNGEWTELTHYEPRNVSMTSPVFPGAPSFAPVSGLRAKMADLAVKSNTLGVTAATKIAQPKEGEEKDKPDAPAAISTEHAE